MTYPTFSISLPRSSVPCIRRWYRDAVSSGLRVVRIRIERVFPARVLLRRLESMDVSASLPWSVVLIIIYPQQRVSRDHEYYTEWVLLGRHLVPSSSTIYQDIRECERVIVRAIFTATNIRQ